MGTDIAQGMNFVFALASEQADVFTQHLHFERLPAANPSCATDGIPVLAQT
jgi:hypothetical protein